ncbi:MAG: chromate transporter [Streptosporangiaceae bacterium]
MSGSGPHAADGAAAPHGPPPRVPIAVIAREWGRIGITGFGGPPAHIALLRELCVRRNHWLAESEFEDGIAATSLLPGPASTQLAIFCAWRLAGTAGAIVGGLCFIAPGLIIILGLSVLFLAHSPPAWVRGAAAGAGAAVPAVAVSAAAMLMPASWRRAGLVRTSRARWASYLLAGAVAANLAGEFLAAVLLVCGLVELLASRPSRLGKAGEDGRQDAGPTGKPDAVPDAGRGLTGDATPDAGPTGSDAVPDAGPTGSDATADAETTGKPDSPGAGRAGGLALPLAVGGAVTAGVLGSLAWVALKVGALSFGGGFVIIPLMQHDAVDTYHWMTTAQFLSAVALGQVTPGPVVQTVAVVGYAAAGLAGGLFAALIAFAPSFAFVLAAGPRFDRFRRSAAAQAFLGGAGPAAIGAIAGAAVTLGLGLTQFWQVAVLAAVACWLLALRRGVVTAILAAAGIGVIVALVGGLR